MSDEMTPLIGKPCPIVAHRDSQTTSEWLANRVQSAETRIIRRDSSAPISLAMLWMAGRNSVGGTTLPAVPCIGWMMIAATAPEVVSGWSGARNRRRRRRSRDSAA